MTPSTSRLASLTKYCTCGCEGREGMTYNNIDMVCAFRPHTMQCKVHAFTLQECNDAHTADASSLRWPLAVTT